MPVSTEKPAQPAQAVERANEIDKADLRFHRAHYATCQTVLTRLGVPELLPNGRPMTVLQRILRIETAVKNLWPEKRGGN